MMEGVKGKAVITFLTAQAQPMWAPVERLSRDFRLPILDNTGLTGNFDFKLQFAPQPQGALPRPKAMDGQYGSRRRIGTESDHCGPNSNWVCD